MNDKILGRWTPGELLACVWNDDMAERFPNADHACCRVDLRTDRCYGLHCNRCGQPTDAQGGHNCPDRPPLEV